MIDQIFRMEYRVPAFIAEDGQGQIAVIDQFLGRQLFAPDPFDGRSLPRQKTSQRRDAGRGRRGDVKFAQSRVCQGHQGLGHESGSHAAAFQYQCPHHAIL